MDGYANESFYFFFLTGVSGSLSFIFESDLDTWEIKLCSLLDP